MLPLSVLDVVPMRLGDTPADTLTVSATLYNQAARLRPYGLVAALAVAGCAAPERICTDSMTRLPQPLEVSVGRDGRDSFGRGGEPAMLLGGAEWVVEDIDGRGIIDRSRATLVFLPDGRIAGRASCNTYVGRWTLDAERLSVGSLAGTMKVCAPALMLQERRFLDRLEAVSRFEITPEGALRLLGDGPGSLLARR